MPPSMSYLESMLAQSRISQSDYDIPSNLITEDVRVAETFKPSHSTQISIAGHISISRTINYRELEAISRVFNTAELLEIILAYLEPQELATCVPLVCNGFRSAIESSVALRRLLFRTPDWSREQHVLLPFQFKSLAVRKVRYYDGDPPRKQPPPQTWHIGTEDMTEEAKGIVGLRSLLFLQPPLKVMVLKEIVSCVTEQVHNESGVTHGDIFQAMERIMGGAAVPKVKDRYPETAEEIGRSWYIESAKLDAGRSAIRTLHANVHDTEDALLSVM